MLCVLSASVIAIVAVLSAGTFQRPRHHFPVYTHPHVEAHVLALRANDGSLLWVQVLPWADFVDGSPVLIAGGHRLVVHVGRSRDREHCSADPTSVTIDAGTGRLLLPDSASPGPGSVRPVSSMKFSGDGRSFEVLRGPAGPVVVAKSVTGSTLWQAPVPDPYADAFRAPTYAGGSATGSAVFLAYAIHALPCRCGGD